MIMKYKTIKINEDFHKELKSFCEKENLKLNKWCETQLKESLLHTKRDIEWAKSPKGSGQSK